MQDQRCEPRCSVVLRGVECRSSVRRVGEGEVKEEVGGSRSAEGVEARREVSALIVCNEGGFRMLVCFYVARGNAEGEMQLKRNVS